MPTLDKPYVADLARSMTPLPPGIAVAIGAVVLVLVFAGVVLIALGLHARAGAAEAVRERETIETLLASAPMQPMVVLPDGRVEMARRVADWLGFTDIPGYFQEVEAAGWGLHPHEAAAMSSGLAACQRSARPFTHTIHARDGGRTLTVQGDRRGEAVILWFYDSTASEGEMRRLGKLQRR